MQLNRPISGVIQIQDRWPVYQSPRSFILFASHQWPHPKQSVSSRSQDFSFQFNRLGFGLKKVPCPPHSSFLFHIMMIIMMISDFNLLSFFCASTQTCILKVGSPITILWHFLWLPRLMGITHNIQKPMQALQHALY